MKLSFRVFVSKSHYLHALLERHVFAIRGRVNRYHDKTPLDAKLVRHFSESR